MTNNKGCVNFPQCVVCTHLIDADAQTCEAFPKGIPEELFFGNASHQKPYKNDRGIMFEAIEEVLVKE